MRYKNLDTSSVLLLAAGAYVITLGWRGQLELYIHPRYVLFTIVLATVGTAIVLASSLLGAPTSKDRTRSWAVLPLAALLLAAFVMPPRPLSSATVSQRSIEGGSAFLPNDAPSIESLLSGSSKGLSIVDWSRLLATNRNPNDYASRPAKISGFIYDANLGPDTVMLSRFIVTCCAVDAQPVSVPLRLPEWERTYAEDQWLEVEGMFELADTQTDERLVLIPGNVTQIDVPSNPYAN